MLLPMPAVTRWGHGAGVAGARAVRRCRWDGRIRAPCVIRGVSAAKRAPPWQDLRAMHSRKAIAGLFGYMARISCQTQLVLDAWRRYVAREGCFSRPGPLRGCMKRKNCHGWPPGNASRRNIAAASHSRTHFAKILPWTNAWIRLAANNDRSPAKQRQRQDPGNAPTKTKEGERFARLLSLFSFTARVARTFEVTSRPP